ncbi:hypothetical protein HHX48_13210 [Salinimonas sp. HHU 13199]|uniref:YcxB-like protein domain-containing protein n=1 Tax=Salinimonas profundi TaxID=2729140 RepID=A0ABR8LRE1_9ALTE|nr:hypothetical protein [Salinimonas profundi]MBD3586700.1 hypothetical protein [Salinimonas profundi]
MFKIKPQLHLVTLNRLLPIFAGAIALAGFTYFIGVSDAFFYGTLLTLILLAALSSLLALFEPFLSQVSICKDNISYITSYGGEIEVKLDHIDYERSVWDKKGLLIVDSLGNNVFLSYALFSKPDVEKVYAFISENSE